MPKTKQKGLFGGEVGTFEMNASRAVVQAVESGDVGIKRATGPVFSWQRGLFK